MGKEQGPSRLVPAPEVCRRYGISQMTLWRWMDDVRLGFPVPVKIRNRNYFREDELDAFDTRMAATGRRVVGAAA
jgi:predicted DNA-binding transcriptional regulator AlpA